jgi:hypothetical protein
MSYQTSWQGSDVQITFEGTVVFEDIYEADNLLYGDPRFDTMKYTLFDLFKVEKFDVSKREVEEIASLDSASGVWNNHIKVAIVAIDPYIVELITVYKNNMAGTKWIIRGFENLRDAIGWCSG